MRLHYVVLVMAISTASYADLGIMDTVSETAAKTEASGMGISTIFDHTSQAPSGSFYVPITYNRPGDPGAGEQDVNSPHNTTDIDYVPLAQLKGAKGDTGNTGAAGVAGSVGAIGNTGNDGAKGATGATGNSGAAGTAGAPGAKGAVGPQGAKGDKGDSADVPQIDPRLNVKIRLYDSKHWSFSSFASFGMQSGTPRYIVGQELELKLGKSAEQREIDKLRKELGR